MRSAAYEIIERPLPKLVNYKRRVIRADAPVLQPDRRDFTTISQAQFAERTIIGMQNKDMRKQSLALLIAAHNEEKVISHTIQSAVNAGMNKSDIFIVDDDSIDSTARIAREHLGRLNVVTVERSGKGLALHKAAHLFRLTERYDWIHIADADGGFDSNYFRALVENLDPKSAAATGYIRSLPGSMIGKYRVYEYTLGMEIARRFQGIAGVIPIIPGPTSCFRSDVFEQLNFADNMLTEDFDVTLQIHRQKLGSIQFIPEAVAYTQDPQTFKDFVRQIKRWNRGVMQGIYKHRIGKKAGKIDAYLSYQVMQNLMFFALNFIWLPFLAISLQNPAVIGIGFLSDVILTFGMVVFAAGQTKRWDIIRVFPFIYGLRWVNLLVFIRAFVEVSILGKFRHDKGVWEGAKRAQLT